MRSFQPPHRLLLGPGPSPVPQRVRNALARPTIGHLDPAFLELMDDIRKLLQYAFRTANRATFPLSGPGSAGMEAVFANLVEPGDKVVVCRNGAFGGRMAEVAARFGARVATVDFEWGRSIDPNEVDAALWTHPDAKVLAFVHAETSTGALSDAEALAGIARKHGCLTAVDAVTSLGGVPLEVDRFGLDAVYAGTQKCLSAPPGISPLTFSERALERITTRRTPVRSWFLDVGLLMGYWKGEGRRAYHHTAPVNALYGLHEALLMLREESIEGAWQRHARCHKRLVRGLVGLGFDLLVPATERLPQLTTVWIPAGVDDGAARQRLLVGHGIEIGAGLGALAGRIWRIGLMGAGADPAAVDRLLAALADVGVQQQEPELRAVG